MIKIENKIDCCGCNACFNICPKNALQMVEDKNGFEYPEIDSNKCINCGLCEKVCPILNKKKVKNSPKSYACMNKDEDIRKKSSSGGIFTLVAEEVINRGGVVFGSQFDNEFKVIHSYVDKKEQLYKFRGSKYVQSIIGVSYKKVKQFLDEGKYVLFTGTPCQVEGLYSFLQKEYNKLFTIDIICHGVPSPKVWKKYLEYRRLKDKEKPTNIEFRNKDNGWSLFNIKFLYKEKIFKQTLTKDEFMQAFLKNMCLRDTCYCCKFKSKNRKADITLADFWGIKKVKPEMYDNKGTSLVIVNSTKGVNLFEKIKEKIRFEETDFEESIKYNPSMICSAKIPKNRDEFFKNLENKQFDELVNKYKPKDNLLKKGIYMVKVVGKKILKR